MSSLFRHTRWLAAVVVVTVLSTLVAFAPALAQNDAPAPPMAPVPARPVAQAQGPGPRQILSDDLVVEEGQRIEETVLVYSGDATIQSGGVIAGNLVVFSGDVEIQGGGSVEGDVTAYSGNVEVNGHVGGDVAAVSGNIDLGDDASVDGNVSAVSGRIDRSDTASVSGNVVQGPSFRFPSAPEREFGNNGVGFTTQRSDGGFLGALLRLFLRLIGAVLITALLAAVVGVLQSVRPDLIARTRGTLEAQTALSFVVGLFGNLTLLFLSGIMAVTLCLLPVALVPMLILLAVNVVGWAVASQIVGERVVAYLKQSVQPALTVAVGAIVLTGIASLLWAFGSCFRVIGFLFILGVASFGSGALVVPWLNRQRGGSAGGSSRGPGGGPSGPQTPPAPSTPEARRGGRGQGSDYVDTDVDRPDDFVTAHEVNLTQSRAQQEAEAQSGKPATGEMRAPGAESTGRTETETGAETSAKPGHKPSGAPGDLGIEDQQINEPDDYVTAQEINTAQEHAREDRFTEIKGIGPVFDQRLKEAGVRTFAQLAAMTPAQVAEVIGWPEERVLRSEIIEQAQALAQG